MRKKLYIIAALIALVIMLGVQSFIVSELYKEKTKDFNRNYENEANNALELYTVQKGLNPLDNAFIQMNGYAGQFMFDYPFMDIQEDSIKAGFFSFFVDILDGNEDMDQFIKDYLENREMDPGFEPEYIIRQLLFYDGFGRPFILMNDSVRPSGLEELSAGKGAIFIRSFHVQYDYFQIEFDYYINFLDKQRMIIREMGTILFLNILSAVIIFLVYVFTLLNMLKQKKLSDIKSDFINHMTHELKTPLSTIAVASSSLAMENTWKDKKAKSNLLDMINRQNKLLGNMIDQILNIGVLERSSFKITKETVDIKEFIEEVADSFRIGCKEKNFLLETIYELDSNTIVSIDKLQMSRVINNLLSNAVKYCEKEPQIRISVNISGDLLKLSVKDNGIGIPREDMKLIFSKFYRCSRHDLQHKIKGLGLGLYFVKRIIEAHDGQIEVESKIFKGSTFIILIPVK